jgi:hypothetical protein
LAREIRAPNPLTHEQTLKCAEDSAHYSQQPAFSLFFHSGDVLRVVVYAVAVQRRTDAKKELKGVTEIVAVIAIERIGAVVDGELSAEAYVDAFAV